MSNPAPPVGARPTSVSAACGLLYLFAALQLASVAVVLLTYGDMQRAVESAYADTDFAEQSSLFATIGVAVPIAGAVLLSAGAIVLAILDGKGKNPARIVTWVFGGLGLCCTGYGLASTLVGSMMNFGAQSPSNGPSPSEVQQILRDNLPSWYYPANIAIGVLEVLVLILVVLLLALPSANRFFRRPPATAEVWEPPLPPTPYR